MAEDLPRSEPISSPPDSVETPTVNAWSTQPDQHKTALPSSVEEEAQRLREEFKQKEKGSELLAKYDISKEDAKRGAQGIVYRATERITDGKGPTVAIKILNEAKTNYRKPPEHPSIAKVY